jgi:hypothetical protein
MPGRRQGNPFLAISHADLAYAVQRLVALGRIRPNEIRQLAGERSTLIEQLEARVAALKQSRAEENAAPLKRGPGRPPKIETVMAAATPRATRRKVTRTAKFVAARKKQGRYMGLRRALSAADQRRAAKIARSKGVDAAIEFIEARRKAA